MVTESKKCEHKLSGAPVTMHKLGETTDSSILKAVASKPGITVSEISEGLNWSNGRVDGSINRLVVKRKVRVQHLLKNGILIKRVYPIESSERPKNIIELPKAITDLELWNKKAFVYALSRSTIGLAAKENSEWKEKSLFCGIVKMNKRKEMIEFLIPRVLENFYQLKNSETSLSSFGSIALVTVESVLPVILPPSHPEEGRRVFSVIAVRERITGYSLGKNFVYLREGVTVGVAIFPENNYFHVGMENRVETHTEMSSDSCNRVIDVKAEVK